MATTGQGGINIQTTPTYGAPFLNPFGNLLANYTVGQLQQPVDIAGLMPQVAATNPLQQAALQQQATQAGLGSIQFNPQGQVTGLGQGTGIAGYQPYLNQAQQYTGPQAYQQFMTPYQQQVIEPTLQQYDIQAQRGALRNPAAAIASGAYGGARQGVEQGVYQSQSDIGRAQLLGNLLNQGYGQANQLANQAFGQQTNLAQLQPSLAYQGINQLGQAGTGQQSYEQSILNALQQGNQIQTQFPFQQLQNAAGIFGALTATPGQPGAPLLTNPALIGAQAAASVLSPFGTTTIGNGMGALGTLAGSAGNGILSTISGLPGAINTIGNVGGGIIDSIGNAASDIFGGIF
jgi:hypothetical protein